MNQLVHGVPIFAGLEEPALSLLSERAVVVDVPAGTLVVREGEPGNRMFVIGSGSVRVCKHFGQLEEVELARLGAKDFFGEMCILETLPRSATIQALTEAKLLGLTSLTFYQLYQQMPGQYSILVLNIARDLSRRLRHLDEIFAARH